MARIFLPSSIFRKQFFLSKKKQNAIYFSVMFKSNLFIRLNYTVGVLIPVLFVGAAVSAHAQKGAFDPHKGVKSVGMVTPTPIDKMMAINLVLGKGKVNWKSVAKRYGNYMDVDSYTDTNVKLPIMMGMRMSDGVLSIMARDVEVLNASAGDIESMAKKLGVGGGQLQRANQVKSFANKNKWNRVFLELGFLQKDVMDTMAKEGNRDRRSLLIAAGWIQGAEMMSSVILDNYSDEASSLLREPLLVKQMIKEIEQLKADKRKDVIVVKMLATLKDLVTCIDVPLHAPVPKDKVKKIHDISSQFTSFMVNG